MKKLYYTADHYKEIKEAVKQIADPVALTLGVRGKNVILQNQYGAISSTNDGVTVAKEIESEDKFKNVVINILKEASLKTNQIVGDGTSTTMILGASMITQALTRLELGTHHANDIVEGLEVVKKMYFEELEKEVVPYNDTNENLLYKIGKVSSRSQEIGDVAVKAVLGAGRGGLTTVEFNNSNKLELHVNEGYGLKHGIVSEYLLNDRLNRQTEYNKVKVLVTTCKIEQSKEGYTSIDPLLTECVEAGIKDLIIFCGSIDDDSLIGLVKANGNGLLNVSVVYVPSIGNYQQDIGEDLAVYCGAKLYSSKRGDDVFNASVADLGELDSAKITTNSTQLISLTNKERIKDQVAALQNHLQEDQDGFTNNLIYDRIAALTGAISTIKVGGNNDIERQAKKDLVDDAVAAVKAAYNYGFVAGGGTTYLNVAKRLVSQVGGDHDECIAIFYTALFQILQTLVDNANYSPIQDIQKAIEANPKAGYNFETGQMVDDMVKEGILDPYLVARLAVENAVAVAKIIIGAGAINVEDNIRMNK